MSMKKEKKTVVGTCRVENHAWIAERRLYNLPLPKDATGAGYASVTRVVVYARDLPAMAFAAKYVRDVDGEWLAAQGYRVSPKPHGERYALFELGDAVTEREAFGPSADVFVCSTRWTGRIDAAFFERPLPECGGRSIPNVFERLRPFFGAWRSARAYNPVQMDFMSIINPMREFPSANPVLYAENAIDVRSGADGRPATPGSRPYRLGEFFCGPGGLACGALSARIENPNFQIVHAWANDYDRSTCDTYVENICPDAPETVVCRDV